MIVEDLVVLRFNAHVHLVFIIVLLSVLARGRLEPALSLWLQNAFTVRVVLIVFVGVIAVFVKLTAVVIVSLGSALSDLL